MKPGEKREILFLDSVGFIDTGKAKEEFFQNLREAAKAYKNENYQMMEFLEKEYQDKRIVKKGLNWHVID
jgi:predicted RNase H-like HicB family nuclease